MITKDCIDSTDAGTVGPHGVSDEMKAQLKAIADDKAKVPENGDRFRLYDADQEHYYSGIIIGDYTSFEPLDDFGEPNAGCVEIRMRNKKTGCWDTV